MKRYIIAVLFVVLLVSYWAWPFLGLQRLAASLEARDEAAIADEVDFFRLRSSLVSQIVAAYSRIVGQKSTIFALAGPNLVEIALLQILTPKSLAELLEGGTISTEIGPVSLDFGALPSISFDSLWRGWLGTEYWMDIFSIGLPVSVPTSEQFRLQMQLKAWQWKVVGIDLPEKLLTPIAQELAKKYP
jgi:hypothetical protein